MKNKKPTIENLLEIISKEEWFQDSLSLSVTVKVENKFDMEKTAWAAKFYISLVSPIEDLPSLKLIANNSEEFCKAIMKMHKHITGCLEARNERLRSRY